MLSLKIGNVLADIAQDTEVLLTKSATDLADPAARGVGYSLGITLPFTPTNNAIFQNLYDTMVSANSPIGYKQKAGQPISIYNTTFNRNLKTPCALNVKGYDVLVGNLVLDRITNAGYEIMLLQGDAAWVARINNSLQALVLPSFCFNLASIANWNVNGDNAYIVYPLIDYGNISEVIYNWNLNPIDGNLLDITDFFPSAFVKKILQQIFLEAGYTLKSAWFDLPENRDLIIPFTNDIMIAKDRFAKVEEDTDMLVGSNSVPIILPPTTILQGALNTITTNIYNQTTSPATALLFTANNLFVCDPAKPFEYEYNFQINVSVNAPPIYGQFGVGIYKNGAFFAGHVLGVGDNIVVGTMPMVQGETFGYSIDNVSTIVTYTINRIDLAYTRIANDNMEGLVFEMAAQLPDISQLDFLKSILVMHNLYFNTNDATKIVTIEPYDTFIEDNVFVKTPPDWTDKIADEKGYTMQFTNQNLAQNVYLTYQQGDDYLCDAFQKANLNRAYGFYKWVNNNKTGDIEQNLEVPSFASSIGARIPFVAGNNQLGGRYFVRLWDIDYRNPDNITDFTFQTNWAPRILKYKYLAPAFPYPQGGLQFLYGYGANKYTTNVDPCAYFELPPYLRSLDTIPPAPSVATDSLSFSDKSPNLVGLYNRYHLALLNRTKTSRQLDVFAHLNVADFYSINFGRPVRIKHQLYLVNSVTDWNANGNGLCKLTLIQI